MVAVASGVLRKSMMVQGGVPMMARRRALHCRYCSGEWFCDGPVDGGMRRIVRGATPSAAVHAWWRLRFMEVAALPLARHMADVGC